MMMMTRRYIISLQDNITTPFLSTGECVTSFNF